MSPESNMPAWQDAAIPGPDVGHNEVMARTLAAKRRLDKKMWGY